jgi:hypothetical protein
MASNRYFEIPVKRRRNRLRIFALVYTAGPAMDELVDLGVVNLDGKTAITSPTSRPATPHSLFGGFPCDFGLDGHIVGRLHNHNQCSQ